MHQPAKDLPLQQLNTGLVRAIIALQLFALAVPVLDLAPEARGLSFFFFIRQDVVVLAVVAVAILLTKPDRAPTNRDSAWLVIFDRPLAICFLALALVAVCWAGHYLVFLGYDLSRDEQMANFDAYIFSHGRLFWPIPPEWRPYADALNQMFMQPVGNYEAWVSGYLPVNAALRAAIGLIADPALTSPLMTALGAVALWRIGLRLWPDCASARAVALILYVGSAQVLLMGMTAYAMSAHLALNLIWLSLFLRDHPASHAAALAVGFLATGLHQPVFHPLFVLPFMCMLFRQQRWRLILFYGIGYGIVCAFWFAWPIWISSHGIGQVAAHNDPAIDYIDRLRRIIRFPDIEALWLMALNLLRFVSWQHLLLMPLALLGIRMAWRGDALVRALAMGLALPITAMLILLPYQGHGWGYRYVHGVIGNACLLGAYGWRSLEAHGRSVHRALLWSSAITFLLLIPARAWMGHRMVAPYAELDKIIAQSSSNIAIIDDFLAPFAQDVVLNRPDLSNRPIRLLSSGLQPSKIKELCSSHGNTLIGAEYFKLINTLFRTKSPPNRYSTICKISLNHEH